MKYILLMSLLIGATVGLTSCASSMDKRKLEYVNLINNLRRTQINGLNIGPAKGVLPNEITSEIIQKGSPIVPYLINALDDDNLNEVIYVVYCLREMGSPKEARPAILKLQRELNNKTRFNIPRDLTLEMQINFFIKDSH